MPFISEELWHAIKDRKTHEALLITQWPTSSGFNEEKLKEVDLLFEIITSIRNIRNTKQIPQKEKLELIICSSKSDELTSLLPSIQKQANLTEIRFEKEKPTQASGFVLKGHEFFVPLAESVDPDSERKRLEDEIKYTKGFLASVEKKLSNERFVSGAPEKVIAIERKKKTEAEEKIKALEEQLKSIVQ